MAWSKNMNKSTPKPLPVPDWLDRVNYNADGLATCIVQDVVTSDVLMLAWVNAESLRRTCESGTMWYWSRSRNEFWNKGATSGALQDVVSLHLDCDNDTLLAMVFQHGGGACHTGAPTCFDPPTGFDSSSPAAPRHIASELLRLVEERDHLRPEGSYTTKLLQGGVDRAGKKVGEEATETVIAAKNAVEGRGTEELANESADLLYHLLVLWRTAGISPFEVVEALRRRR
jgi:phosphoribosyl-ATP pyrophosphohydrolase/phosphoribosyl-AMP cyclohydrolase